jgi:hypothetical protein
VRRTGYACLTKLCNAAWAKSDAHWAALGYPGPPSLPGVEP